MTEPEKVRLEAVEQLLLKFMAKVIKIEEALSRTKTDPVPIIDNSDPTAECFGCGNLVTDRGFTLFLDNDRYPICPVCHRSTEFWDRNPGLATFKTIDYFRHTGGSK